MHADVCFRIDAEVERMSLLKTQFDDHTSKNILHSETHKARIKLVSLHFVFCPTSYCFNLVPRTGI
jgi:hypothetical protein